MSMESAQNWAETLGTVFASVSEGLGRARPDAGAGSGGAGTAGVTQYQNQSHQQAQNGNQQMFGFDSKWLLIGVVAVVGIIVLKKVL